ncbi:hypothetical protein ACTXT7_005361 [Hymenolepis weldensis]
MAIFVFLIGRNDKRKKYIKVHPCHISDDGFINTASINVKKFIRIDFLGELDLANAAFTYLSSILKSDLDA